MLVKFADHNGESHEINFTLPNGFESIMIEDELGVGAMEFVDLVFNQMRGKAMRMFLRILYRRCQLTWDDRALELSLDQMEFNESERERKERERSEIDEVAPAVVATLRDYGVDATDVAVRRKLAEHSAGKEVGGLEGDGLPKD